MNKVLMHITCRNNQQIVFYRHDNHDKRFARMAVLGQTCLTVLSTTSIKAPDKRGISKRNVIHSSNTGSQTCRIYNKVIKAVLVATL